MISWRSSPIRRNAWASRIAPRPHPLDGSAYWTLIAQDRGRTRLSRGSAKAVDGLNVIDTQYFMADMENEAVTWRLADALADQIVMQLAAYFRKRATASG